MDTMPCAMCEQITNYTICSIYYSSIEYMLYYSSVTFYTIHGKLSSAFHVFLIQIYKKKKDR